MKRILFIAPHCYPIKSSESICNSKVAYTLAKAGYQVDVFTCSNASTYPSDVKIDQKLRNSENLSIVTVIGCSIKRTMKIWQLLRLLFHHLFIFLKTGYYYNGIDYPYQIVKAIKKKIKEEGKMPYDVMITRGFHTDYAGIYMAKKYGLKWISNWNDPYPNIKFPVPYGKGFDAKLRFYEQRIYDDIQKYADVFTFPSERLRDYMLKCFTKIGREKTMVIHHMAHCDLSISNRKCKKNIVRFVHSGSVNNPRNPECFLKALSIVVKKVTIRIECVFIGGYDENIKQIVNTYRLNDHIQFLPSMPYSESLEYLAFADYSLIIEAVCEEGIYLPTKFVDALQTNVPVFCVSPKVGTLSDICAKYNVGYCCDNTKVQDIEEKLLKAIDDKIKSAMPIILGNTAEEFFNNYILKQYNSIL